MVSYKTGAAFRPKDIRDALKKTDVGVTEFQISARGQVQQQSGSVYSLPAKMCFFLSRQPVRHEATIFLSSAFVDTPWKIVFRFIERLLQSRKSFFHGIPTTGFVYALNTSSGLLNCPSGEAGRRECAVIAFFADNLGRRRELGP
jgi:hypothetical protein